MQVIVSGPYRTGTTHTFMIVQELFNAVGTPYVALGANKSTIFEYLDCSKSVVIKSHDVYFPKPAGVKIIQCTRNPYDAVMSRMRILGGRHNRKQIREIVKCYYDYSFDYKGRTDVLLLDYDVLYYLSGYKIERIARFLGIAVTPEMVTAIAEKTSIPKIRVKQAAIIEADDKSQLRPEHIGPKLGVPGAYECPAVVRKEIEKFIAISHTIK